MQSSCSWGRPPAHSHPRETHRFAHPAPLEEADSAFRVVERMTLALHPIGLS